MAFERSGCSGSTSRTTKRGMKTPWTPSEDMMLLQYIRKHGEGNWSSIQMEAGLKKSGKSCRNRWANYLRPNLKKGAFSAEEERLIIELHGKFGNKWARIAAQLPGRTDNEVKNYWNIRLKKSQRSGLAIHHQEMCQTNQPLNSSPSPTFSALLASFRPQDPNTLCLATPNNGAEDVEVIESNMQVDTLVSSGTEAEASGSGTNFIGDELSRLLDDSSSSASPLAEWDDLHPRLCFDLAYKY